MYVTFIAQASRSEEIAGLKEIATREDQIVYLQCSLADYHASLKEKYETAARRSWLRIEPVPHYPTETTAAGR
jgi:hypothetical protein